MACFLCSSCNDYLNIAPKGNKIPTTLADFEALLRDQYTISRTPVENALYLLNDVYLTNAKVNANVEAYKAKLSETWEEMPPMFVTSAEKRTGKEELLAYIDSINKSLKASE